MEERPGSTTSTALRWNRVSFWSNCARSRFVINDQMTAADHVSSLLASCSRLLYALRVLQRHGIPPASINDIFRWTVIAKLLYCAPAWSGFCSAKDRARLDAFLRRCRRLGYCGSDISTVAELFDEDDETLFHHILTNNNHVLQSYLPDRSRSQYNLRTGAHSKRRRNSMTETL